MISHFSSIFFHEPRFLTLKRSELRLSVGDYVGSRGAHGIFVLYGITTLHGLLNPCQFLYALSKRARIFLIRALKMGGMPVVSRTLVGSKGPHKNTNVVTAHNF